MIRLSVNILTSAITLLKRIETYHYSSLSELIYSKIASISAEDIFNLASECGWVVINENKPLLTNQGSNILLLQEQGLLNDAKRQMLADYILNVFPIWSNRIPYGRSEAVIFMTSDEKACFSEANLLSKCLEQSVIEWWDSIASQIRARSQQAKNDTGRIGERSTIKYERDRTTFEPKWMAIDSNLTGYDVISQKSRDNSTALLIEVKTSTLSLCEANFHVTSNEWNAATTSAAYVFHLWCFSAGKKKLAIISPDELRPYIPTNNLKGKWESAKIPFSCFENKFIEMA